MKRGWIVGGWLVALVAYHNVLQFGEALADDGKIPAWAGLWLPFALFTVWSLHLFVRSATRVPDPRFALWLDLQLERLRRLLPTRRGTASPSA